MIFSQWKKIGKVYIDGFGATKSNKVPNWILNAINHWEEKLGHRPYDLTKYFYGKSFTYKVQCKTIAQGKVEGIVYRKRKEKEK